MCWFLCNADRMNGQILHMYICIIFSSSSVYSECRCYTEQILALLVIICSIVVTDVPDLVCAVHLFSGCCYLYEFRKMLLKICNVNRRLYLLVAKSVTEFNDKGMFTCC